MNPNNLHPILLTGSGLGALIAAVTLSQIAGVLSLVFTVLGIINLFFPLKINRKK